MTKNYQIGDLSQKFGVPVENIRFFERKGMLAKAKRTEGNYRIYDESHIEQLAFILNCRALDMTHEEINQLLKMRSTPDADCDAASRVIDEHIGHVSERIKALRGLQKQLTELRERCNRSSTSKNCGILESLAEKSLQRHSRKVAPHSHGGST